MGYLKSVDVRKKAVFLSVSFSNLLLPTSIMAKMPFFLGEIKITGQIYWVGLFTQIVEKCGITSVMLWKT